MVEISREDVSHDGDLASVGRIRQAALRLFATQGVSSTPLRAIAAESQVTVGLIPHHFGSKNGLRDDLERWIVLQFADALAQANAAAGEKGADARDRQVHVDAMLEKNPHIKDYMRREFLHPYPGGTLLNQLTDLIAASVDDMRERGFASSSRDRTDQVVAAMVRQLGALFLQPMVDQVIDALPRESRPASAPELVVDMRRPKSH
ncbi:TetR/AcrR family transcriptional regulator [Brevibacterium jeotgali]|uniref:Transcriptional regulator, TetR family n=1 Tax=Brevibacterium jeotgali TaxID=1262550 RepID=A0A2H1L2K8_9MICO|nr:TetR/AcrR family transcriptional regulator [Brevibacterium jeotgali]TWC02330.1 TetR family transcriptional regulator [Brevibacterium jeotgali]SMY11122.1 transcriptional regulator, TetR family [Brevibacterium jeotgali]